MSRTHPLRGVGLADAAYPQRETQRAWPAVHAAWQVLRATLRPAARAARLPAEVEQGLARTRAALAELDDAALAATVPRVRAELRAAGLAGAAAGTALALAAEMAQRRLGFAAYPTQLLGAWLMLDGQLAEMATGEGKTLAAGLAAAAAALAGVPVHLLTANDYLVQRDRTKLAPLYDALGLRSACVLPALSRPERAAAYRHDVVHLTARELAFDYLRDHLLLGGVRDPRLLRARTFAPADTAAAADAPVLPGLCLALIDEADSILLDEASVPLILASPADALQTESCARAMAIAQHLRRGRDYLLHAAQRRCELTAAGCHEVDAALAALPGDAGLLRPARRAHEFVAAALSARHALQRERDYLVADGRLLLIDEVTGRVAEGRQWTGELQTMVELEEQLAPSPATRVSAQITYQAFFPRYLRLGGMSGTLREARGELAALYGARVQRVPLARPDRRRWQGEQLYATRAQRDAALVRRVAQLVAAGRPVLVGTPSVAASARVSARLLAAGIRNQLLNAAQDADEAAAIAQAGCAGVVTVATNIAGRGTDIALDAAAREAGGLHVIATMRNRTRRIDRQLIGRAARHGDPGSAEALLALDEALFAEHLPAAWRRLAGRSAGADGVLPSWLATPLAALTQRRAEAHERTRRSLLRHAQRQADELFAFAGGVE